MICEKESLFLVVSDIEFIEQAPTVYVIGQTSVNIEAIHQYLDSIGEEWNQVGAQAPYLLVMPDYSTEDELQRNQEWLREQYVGTANAFKPMILSNNDIEIRPNPAGVTDPQLMIEAAGRVCYGSWNNPAGRTTEEYIQEQIVKHRHESVLEHLTFNCLVQNLPRSTQLELVRHRVGVAYSFESTRFTDKRLRFVVPPAIRGDLVATIRWKGAIREEVEAYHAILERVDVSNEEGTMKRKRAKEAARSLLPNAQASDGVVTLNARAARHIITLRSSDHADASIREFAVALYDALAPLAPAVFADLVKEEHHSGTPTVRMGEQAA